MNTTDCVHTCLVVSEDYLLLIYRYISTCIFTYHNYVRNDLGEASGMMPVMAKTPSRELAEVAAAYDSAPAKHAGGRPTKMTPEACTRALEATIQGQTRYGAAALAGVHVATLLRHVTENDEFREALEDADAMAEALLVRRVRDAPDWRAQMAILERRFRDRWSRSVEVAGSADNPIQFVIGYAAQDALQLPAGDVSMDD